MKKVLSVLLLLTFIFSLTACNKKIEPIQDSKQAPDLKVEETKVFNEAKGQVKDLPKLDQSLDLQNIKLTIDGAEIYGQDAFQGNQRPVLLFAYRVKNLGESKIDTEATWMDHVKVLQKTPDGLIELNKGKTFQDHEKFGDYFESQGYHVKPGEEIKAGIMYDVENPSYPVYLQFFDGEKNYVKTISIK